MNLRRWNAPVLAVLLATGALLGACRKVYTYAVVPRPSGGNYRPDTLRAVQNGNDVRVIFRFDTVTRTRTVYKTDTLWMEGKQIIRDTVRLVRRDTVRVVRRDTIRLTRVDTLRLAGYQAVNTTNPTPRRVDTVRVTRVDTVRFATGGGRVDTVRVPVQVVQTVTRVDTLRRHDTVYVTRGVQGGGPTRRDTVRVVVTDTVRVVRRDTVRVVRADTVRVVRVDTVRVVRVDTVRVTVAGRGTGGRKLFVPPGHYPPEGQCRVWVDGTPPGRQRDAAACDKLGDIPAGAFILYGGVAWDFDYDWVAAGDGSAPPQIIALKRKR
jgi:hypothetical protein